MTDLAAFHQGKRVGQNSFVVPYFDAKRRVYSEATGVTLATAGETDVLAMRSFAGELFFDLTADVNIRLKLKNTDGGGDFALTNKTGGSSASGYLNFTESGITSSTTFTHYDYVVRFKLISPNAQVAAFWRYGTTTAIAMASFTTGANAAVGTCSMRIKRPDTTNTNISFGTGPTLTLGAWYFVRGTIDSVTSLYVNRLYNANGVLVSTRVPTVTPPNGSVAVCVNGTSGLSAVATGHPGADGFYLSQVWEKRNAVFSQHELDSIFNLAP